MRRGYVLGLGALVISGLYGRQAHGQLAPTVDISFTTTAGPVVTIGSTFDVSVLAEVENPSDPSAGGIFVFSQDLTLSNLLPGATPAFSILSVTTPNVDPALGGGTGTLNPAPAPGDVAQDEISGGYDASDLGEGTPTVLYTVELKAVAAGSATVLDGPDADPYFTQPTGGMTPDGFELYDFSYPAADYPTGPTFVAVPVSTPEPATGLVSLVVGVAALRRRRSV